MNSRHLRYFVTVAEELHFGRAAARLGIAQPPLSQQIRQFESHLGVELFHRSSRNVELTEAGQALLTEARLILNHMEAAEQLTKRFADGHSGRLNIGAVSPILDTFLPSLLSRFRSSNPGVHVVVHEIRSRQQTEWLQTRRLDMGFVRLVDAAPEHLSCRVLRTERYVLALPEDHALSTRRSLSLKHLHQQPLIMAPRSHRPQLHDRILASLQAAGATVHIGQEATSKRSEIAFVAAGLGLALVPESYQQVFPRDGVVYRQLRGDLPDIRLAALWHPSRLSAAGSRLLQLIATWPPADS